MTMHLKPQDLLIVLHLLSRQGRTGSYARLSEEIGVSASECHAGVKRARRVGLVHPLEDVVVKAAAEEFLLHALKYCFPVSAGRRTRGMATGYCAPPLVQHFGNSSGDPNALVWPDPEGEQPGYEIQPLCRSAPGAARRDPQLYEWLVLVDALRGAGRARERELAVRMVRERLGSHAPD